MEWTREEFAVRDQALQFLDANGNPLDADERKLLCHFIVELRRILACMLSPHVVAAGWRNAGLHPFNIRTILNHSTKFRQLPEAEQQRIEDKVKELMGVARYDGDLSPEEFWEVMPEKDKEVRRRCRCLSNLAIREHDVKGGDAAAQGCSGGQGGGGSGGCLGEGGETESEGGQATSEGGEDGGHGGEEGGASRAEEASRGGWRGEPGEEAQDQVPRLQG